MPCGFLTGGLQAQLARWLRCTLALAPVMQLHGCAVQGVWLGCGCADRQGGPRSEL